MPRRLIKKYFPDSKTIKEHKHLKVFGTLLHNPSLWHLNRRSFAGAIAVGLFIAFIPLPTQMIIAAAAAIVLHVNLPVSVAMVWITNPLTMPPMFYAAYWVGALILGIPESAQDFEFTVDALMSSLGASWQPFLLGCFVLACSSAAAGYALARYVWRRMVVKRWLARQHPVLKR